VLPLMSMLQVYARVIALLAPEKTLTINCDAGLTPCDL
jgi:hypothetical protein